jgi:hypothetical protein
MPASPGVEPSRPTPDRTSSRTLVSIGAKHGQEALNEVFVVDTPVDGVLLAPQSSEAIGPLQGLTDSSRSTNGNVVSANGGARLMPVVNVGGPAVQTTPVPVSEQHDFAGARTAEPGGARNTTLSPSGAGVQGSPTMAQSVVATGVAVTSAAVTGGQALAAAASTAATTVVAAASTAAQAMQSAASQALGAAGVLVGAGSGPAPKAEPAVNDDGKHLYRGLAEPSIVQYQNVNSVMEDDMQYAQRRNGLAVPSGSATVASPLVVVASGVKSSSSSLVASPATPGYPLGKPPLSPSPRGGPGNAPSSSKARLPSEVTIPEGDPAASPGVAGTVGAAATARAGERATPTRTSPFGAAGAVLGRLTGANTGDATTSGTPAQPGPPIKAVIQEAVS